MSIERKKAKIEINKLDIELKELELLKVKNALLNVEIELSEESVTMEDLQVLAEDLLERYSKEELDKLIEDIEAKEKTAEDGSKYLDTDFEELMRENNLPLYTLESKTPVRDCDIVGFTLQYEMSFTTILNMIDLAGMKVLKEESSLIKHQVI